jgi:hypothetical protein
MYVPKPDCIYTKREGRRGSTCSVEIVKQSCFLLTDRVTDAHNLIQDIVRNLQNFLSPAFLSTRSLRLKVTF